MVVAVLFFKQTLHSPGWPKTHDVTQTNLKHVAIFLPPSLSAEIAATSRLWFAFSQDHTPWLFHIAINFSLAWFLIAAWYSLHHSSLHHPASVGQSEWFHPASPLNAHSLTSLLFTKYWLWIQGWELGFKKASREHQQKASWGNLSLGLGQRVQVLRTLHAVQGTEIGTPGLRRSKTAFNRTSRWVSPLAQWPPENGLTPNSHFLFLKIKNANWSATYLSGLLWKPKWANQY